MHLAWSVITKKHVEDPTDKTDNIFYLFNGNLAACPKCFVMSRRAFVETTTEQNNSKHKEIAMKISASTTWIYCRITERRRQE